MARVGRCAGAGEGEEKTELIARGKIQMSTTNSKKTGEHAWNVQQSWSPTRALGPPCDGSACAPLISHPYFLPLPGLPLPAGVALLSAEPGREVLLLEPAVSEAFLVACTASASTWVGSGSRLGLG